MNETYSDMTYVFHSTRDYSNLIQSFIVKSKLTIVKLLVMIKLSFIYYKDLFFLLPSQEQCPLKFVMQKYPQLSFIKWVF